MSCIKVGTRVLSYIIAYANVNDYYSSTESYVFKNNTFSLPPITVSGGELASFCGTCLKTIDIQYFSFNFKQRLQVFI